MMKRIFAIFLCGILGSFVVAQSPEKMSYQAVVRDAENNLVRSSSIGLQISILQGSVTGPAVYVETQTPGSNANGLINIEIGNGTVVTGDFSAIDWATGLFFIKTEIDPTGGINYTITGTSQLLSVPYALHAKTAGGVTGSITETDPVFAISEAKNISSSDIFSWNNKSDFSGNYADLNGRPSIPESLADLIHDAGDKTITNLADPVNPNDAVNKSSVTFRVSETGDSLFLGSDQFVIIPGISYSNNRQGTPVNDVDGNSYNTLRIGTQVWMGENLRTTKYNNGDVIGTTVPATLVLSGELAPKYQWAYNGDELNVPVYGRLYTWHTVTDSRNLCPSGWHVSSASDWTTMMDFLIANGFNYDGTYTGDKVAKALASDNGWTFSSNAGAVGNTDFPAYRNKSGFTAQPGGSRAETGQFYSIGLLAAWWTSTVGTQATCGVRRHMPNNWNYMLGDACYSPKEGSSVRCVKD